MTILLTIRSNIIRNKIIVGFLLVTILDGCSTLRDSLFMGAGTGAATGGIIGNQQPGDRTENTIKGAVIGGVVGGLASYFIHGALEKRDDSVRRETLMNLEHYDVLGLDGVKASAAKPNGQCYETRDVDGRSVSVPCQYLDPDSGRPQ
jgi:hypothetical protein